MLVRAYSIQPFQSTHPRGVRPARISAVLIYRAVSIHAPAWGATAAYWPAGGLYQGFNPRTRVGCDPKASPTTFPTKSFQSTHPRGVRRARADRRFPTSRGFNPRTRVGCDVSTANLSRWINGFNPRTRVGCDSRAQARVDDLCRFQSTHPRGVRRRAWRTRLRVFLRFNPRTRVGCDGQ